MQDLIKSHVQAAGDLGSPGSIGDLNQHQFASPFSMIFKQPVDSRQFELNALEHVQVIIAQ